MSDPEAPQNGQPERSRVLLVLGRIALGIVELFLPALWCLSPGFGVPSHGPFVVHHDLFCIEPGDFDQCSPLVGAGSQVPKKKEE
jgi:hypothetical protein